MKYRTAGTASVARGYSGYLDSLLNNSMQTAFRRYTPLSEPFLAEYPDWTAFSITILLAVLLRHRPSSPIFHERMSRIVAILVS